MLEFAGIYHETMALSGSIRGQGNWEPWFTATMERCDAFLEKVREKYLNQRLRKRVLASAEVQYDAEG